MAEADDRAAFEAVVEGSSEGPEPEVDPGPAPPPFESRTDGPQPAQEDAQGDEGVESDHGAAEEPEGSEAPTEDHELERAREFLRRARIPAAVVRRMDRQELLDAAEDAREAIRWREETYRRAQGDGEEGEGQESTDEEPGRKSVPAGAPSYATLQPHAKAFLDAIGGDDAAGEALVGLLNEFAKLSMGPIAEAVADQDQALRQALERSGRAKQAELRRHLGERFSEVSDSDRWSELQQEMEMLARFRPDDFESAEDLALAAARRLGWADQRGRESREERKARSERRQRGMPTTSKTRRKAPQTREQHDWEVFNKTQSAKSRR